LKIENAVEEQSRNT